MISAMDSNDPTMKVVGVSIDVSLQSILKRDMVANSNTRPMTESPPGHFDSRTECNVIAASSTGN